MNPSQQDAIDALLDYLKLSQPDPRWADSLTALVAERDALKQRVAELEVARVLTLSRAFQSEEALRHDRDRDLRERLLESALRGAGCRLGIIDAEELGRQAMWIVNGALAAMRKGESDGK